MDLFFDCPNCSMPVKRGAAACPHCGADEQAGWSSAAVLDRLDLPRPLSDSEYEEFREQILGPEKPWRRKGWMIATSCILLVMFIIWGSRC